MSMYVSLYLSRTYGIGKDKMLIQIPALNELYFSAVWLSMKPFG
uniref:Uncharacterized protein n=1 Tax=Rhizophora mucronata TaxID=61149 RepID=A0A2P2MGF3_RHIMU